MRVVERASPIAAVIAAVSSLACCLPLSFLGAAGLLAAGARMQALRPWLLGASIFLLIVGFVQLYLRRGQCLRRSRMSIAIFWIAAVFVLMLILFPQLIASILAG